jgi:hypothetical protein
LLVKDDEHKQGIKNYEVSKHTDVFRETEALTQVTLVNVQQLDVFNCGYTPTEIPSYTALERASTSIDKQQFLNFLTFGDGDG